MFNAAGDTAILNVIPKSAPSSAETVQLVADIRAAAPAIEAETGIDVGVTGQTAIIIDISRKLGDALLPYLLVVVGLAFLLLTLVFRSLLVPLTATLGFLLSVARHVRCGRRGLPVGLVRRPCSGSSSRRPS